MADTLRVLERSDELDAREEPVREAARDKRLERIMYAFIVFTVLAGSILTFMLLRSSSRVSAQEKAINRLVQGVDSLRDQVQTLGAEPVVAPGVDISKGEPGAVGPPGPQGQTGPPGATGDRGVDGSAGAQGVAGPTGATGSAGSTGATGSTGPAGAAGAQGATGPAGPAGATGEPGATGEQGVAGPQGLPGLNGAPGAVGPTGPPPKSFTFTVIGRTFTCTPTAADPAVFACTS